MGSESSGRPGGNPILKGNEVVRTGPKSLDGKAKIALANYQMGSYAKTLQTLYTCGNCPLRGKWKHIEVNGKVTRAWISARCPVWTQERADENKGCVLDVPILAEKLKMYFEVEEKYDTTELQRMIAYEMFEQAQLNKNFETVSEGRGKFYTNKYLNDASTVLERYHKMKYGEKPEVHKHLHVGGDMAEKILDRMEKDIDGNE